MFDKLAHTSIMRLNETSMDKVGGRASLPCEHFVTLECACCGQGLAVGFWCTRVRVSVLLGAFCGGVRSCMTS